MVMAKEKRTAPENRKPFKFIRVRNPIVAALEELAKRNATDATEEANRGIREYLERNGLWPPPKEG